MIFVCTRASQPGSGLIVFSVRRTTCEVESSVNILVNLFFESGKTVRRRCG